MKLLDSNVVIYAADLRHSWLADWIDLEEFRTSTVTKIEVLGYHKLTFDQTKRLEPFFGKSLIIPMDDEIEKVAISLRSQKRMGLGDAIIGATALVYDFELVTRNVKDFDWITGLKIINPFDLLEEDGLR
jgi:toxin FitB